jgi:hypothetical protein
MRDEFSMPGYTVIGNLSIQTHEFECAVEIEPDEMVGLTSWYVARVYIQGTVRGRGRLRWFEIAERNPLFDTIKYFALDACEDRLAELWDEYLADHPVSRERPDRDEHRTYP